ncbi:MAG TPA: condensation domain-containing protein, partial [Bradyrhizobium sp.]|nr:condensation domain-containing protein [Bradyrhizobium sp.]
MFRPVQEQPLRGFESPDQAPAFVFPTDGLPMTTDPHVSLSAAQLEIWLAQALEPDSPVYTVGEVIHLPKSLDLDCFEQALARAVDETDALHVRFSHSDRGPVQRVGVPSRWSLAKDPTPLRSDVDLAKKLEHELAVPIAIEGDCLARSLLLRFEDGHFAWCQLYHHIAMDGYARALFAKRVAETYSRLVSGRDPDPRHFGAFNELLVHDWDYRASTEAADDRAYWRKELAGFDHGTTAAGYHPNRGGFRRQTEHLSPGLTASLQTAAGTSGLSVATILCAVAAVISSCGRGSDDTVIGFVVSGRPDTVARKTPGAVSNVVPLRLTVNLQASWRELLAEIRQKIKTALQHQRTRLEDIRRDLNLTGAGDELTSIVVNVIPFFEHLQFGDDTAKLENLSNGPVDDYSVVAYPNGREPQLRIDFNANGARRDDEDLNRFRRRFLQLLARLTSDLDSRVGSVDLLLEDERDLVLEGWNATAAPLPELLP